MSKNDPNPSISQAQAINNGQAQAQFADLARTLGTIPAIASKVNDHKKRFNDIESEIVSDETLSDMQKDISEIEEELELINTTLQSRIQSTEAQQEGLYLRIEELESDQDGGLDSRVETLEKRVETLESLFTPHTLGKEQAHIDAQKKSVEEVLDIGETREVIVEETLFDQHEPQFKTTIRGVVTFVDIESRDLEKGDTIEIKICDRRDTCACAKPVRCFD